MVADKTAMRCYAHIKTLLGSQKVETTLFNTVKPVRQKSRSDMKAGRLGFQIIKPLRRGRKPGGKVTYHKHKFCHVAC
jgi:hypothetical protein